MVVDSLQQRGADPATLPVTEFDLLDRGRVPDLTVTGFAGKELVCEVIGAGGRLRD